MSTKFYNTQWQMPNEANKSKQANHSLQAGTTTSGERVDITNLPFSDSQSWTISFWVRPTTISAAALTFGGSQNYSGAGGFIFLLNVGGSITFYSNPNRTYFSFATGNNVVSVDTWHHVIFKYNYGVDYRIYVDGVLQAVSTGQVASDLLYQWPTQNFGLFEKALPGYTGYRLRGSLSDWCFFNYALSDTATTVGDTATGQIAQLYGNGSSLSNPMDLSPAPKVYYKLSDSVWDGSKYITANNAVQDYVFDNTVSSRIFTNINVSNLTNVTQAVWFKTSTNGQLTKHIFHTGQYGTFVLQLYGTDTLRIGVTVNPLTQTYPSLTFNYADGKWHQYVVNYDGSHVKLYIDGVLKIKTARAGDLRNEPTYFTTIGNIYNPNSNAGATGEYSNFISYEHTLTDGGVSVGDTATGEIATLYNNGSPIRTLANIPQSSNLKAWYKLDASEIYNNTTTEWEISDATAAIKLSTLQNPPGTFTENAYRVSDSSGVINFPSNYNDTLKISTSVWFYAPSSVSSGQVVQLLHAGPQSRLWLGFSGTNQLRAIITGGGWMYGNNVTMGQWNQFTATINIVSNTRTVKFYINGQPAGTGTQSGGSPTSASDGITVSTYGSGTYSGQVLSSNSVFWDNVILTDAEVLSHYNSFSVSNGLPTLQPALSSFPQSSSISGWYKLDGNPKDSSGNSRDATYGSHNNVNIGPSVSNSNGQSSNMSQSNLVQSDLQTVASYSKYAMSFDGVSNRIEVSNLPTFFNSNNVFSISCWVKRTTDAETFVCAWGMQGGGGQALYALASGASLRVERGLTTDVYISNFFPLNEWVNLTTVFNSSTNVKIYKNGSFIQNITVSATPTYASNIYFYIGNGINGGYGLHGDISNLAIWNYELNALQVREIYNEGRPSDLNTFSGTAPTHWWKLGEGVSYDGTYLYVQDYIGNNTGISNSGMDQADIVDGVGTSLNGTGEFSAPSATVTNIINNAPYSDKNAVSINMESAKSNSGISNSTPQAT